MFVQKQFMNGRMDASLGQVRSSRERAAERAYRNFRLESSLRPLEMVYSRKGTAEDMFSVGFS